MPLSPTLLKRVLRTLPGTRNQGQLVVVALKESRTVFNEQLCVLALFMTLLTILVLAILAYLIIQDRLDECADDAAQQDTREDSSLLEHPSCTTQNYAHHTCFAQQLTSVSGYHGPQTYAGRIKLKSFAACNCSRIALFGPKTELEHKFAGSLSQIDEDNRESADSNESDMLADRLEAKFRVSEVSTELTNHYVPVHRRKPTEELGHDHTDPDLKLTERASSRCSHERTSSSEITPSSGLFRASAHPEDSFSRDGSQPRTDNTMTPRYSRRVKSFGAGDKLFCSEPPKHTF